MKRIEEFFNRDPGRWEGGRRVAVWVICIGFLASLGTVRTATESEFAFASLALFPVLVMGWMGGRSPGLAMAFLAAAMWTVADLASDRAFSTHWIPWLNAAVLLVTYSVVAMLAAQVQTRLAHERETGKRDALTGLFNRRALVDAGHAEAERAQRYKAHMAVVFLDLDNFKSLNDTAGHHTGDQALQAIARALLKATRANDVVSRLGGDEFAVILPEIDFDAAVLTGQKIFDALNASMVDFSPVTVSVGVAWFDQVELKFPAMLRMADQVMYRVKAASKCDFVAERFSGSD